MTDHYIYRRFQIIVLLMLIVIVCSCLQTTQATAFSYAGHAVIKTADCHLIFKQLEVDICCPSRSCHQTSPVQRDLGCPEYHTQRVQAHPLTAEYRSLSPQFRAGQAIITTVTADTNLLSIDTLQHSPLQALLHLRTVILLH